MAINDSIYSSLLQCLSIITLLYPWLKPVIDRFRGQTLYQVDVVIESALFNYVNHYLELKDVDFQCHKWKAFIQIKARDAGHNMRRDVCLSAEKKVELALAEPTEQLLYVPGNGLFELTFNKAKIRVDVQDGAISLKCRTQGCLKDFITEVRRKYHTRESDEIIFKIPAGKGEWLQKKEPARPATSLFLGEILHEIVNSANDFIKSEQWCQKNGQPFHTAFFFGGKPGCGKTSTVSVLATLFNLQVWLLKHGELSHASLNTLTKRWLGVSIVVLDDFHKISFSGEPGCSQDDRVSYADFLSFIDGLGTPHGAIFIIISNNSVEEERAKRPELFRRGRIDDDWVFPYPDKSLREDMLQSLFKDNNLPNKDALISSLAGRIPNSVSQADIARLARIKRHELERVEEDLESVLRGLGVPDETLLLL